MTSVVIVEARKSFGAQLALVMKGESCVITCSGKPVARLVPETAMRGRSAAKAAVERIRARARARMEASIGVEAL